MIRQADFLAAQQRALRAIEEAHAFLRLQVEEINAERVARGKPPLPGIKPLPFIAESDDGLDESCDPEAR